MKKVALIGLSLGLIACGDSSLNEDSAHIGVFLDSPVANIEYRTETLSGVTSAKGEYNYKEGETVTFFIGELEFPSVAAKKVVTPLDLAGSTDVSSSTVVNILRLLQTLDVDGNPDNGITIPELAKSNAVKVDFEQTVEDFELSSGVTNLIANSGAVNVALVSIDDAVDHFEASISNIPLVSPNAIQFPVRPITIDGDNSDWLGIQPIGVDPNNDQNGSSSTDLHKVSVVQSGDSIALLMEVSGEIQLYHTSNTVSSHYEVAFHFHDNSSCSGDSNGFFIVNNFTMHYGDNHHRVEGYFSDMTLKNHESQHTVTAHSGSYLETSFSKSLLPRDKGNYISLYSYIQSFKENSKEDGLVSTLHDELHHDVCFSLPLEE